MADYVVRQGDCFASIAAHWGLDIDGLAALGDNQRYQEEGQSPHILRPGDVIEVPDQPPNRSAKFSSGGTASYKVTRPDVRFRLRVRGRGTVEYASKRYELSLTIPGHRPRRGHPAPPPLEGTTDEHGWLEQMIPAAVREGVLKVFVDESKAPWEFRLSFGALQAASTNAGVSQRLHNLGFGLANGEEARTQSLASFQRSENRTPNGRIDDETRQRLETRRQGG